MKQSNVIKLSDKRTVPVNENSLLIQNLGQVLDAVVRVHGAHTTLQAVQGMIQDIQTQVRAERSAKPKTKAVSNG